MTWSASGSAAPAEEVLFVSSNGWDAAGASGYGFVTAWVNRAGEPVDRLPWKPAAHPDRFDHHSRTLQRAEAQMPFFDHFGRVAPAIHRHRRRPAADLPGRPHPLTAGISAISHRMPRAYRMITLDARGRGAIGS